MYDIQTLKELKMSIKLTALGSEDIERVVACEDCFNEQAFDEHVNCLWHAVTCKRLLDLEWMRIYHRDIFQYSNPSIAGKWRIGPAGHYDRNAQYRIYNHRVIDYLPGLERNIRLILHDRQLKPFMRLAIAHYEFTSLHPFIDGNGRIGRIMLNNHAAYLKLGVICLTDLERDDYLTALENHDLNWLASIFRHNIL